MTINIEDLTIKQARELQEFFALNKDEQSGMLQDAIGKYVICRSQNEGVNAGFLIAADSTGCNLIEVRRLKTHMPAKGSWYESVALTGLNYKESVVSAPAPEKFIIEDYSLTVCTDEAAQSIQDMPSYES